MSIQKYPPETPNYFDKYIIDSALHLDISVI